MKKTRLFHKFMSIILCIAIIMGCIPASALKVSAATLSKNAIAENGVVADPGTAYTWESMLGTSADGNRYAGRVWVDKSVYEDGATALLNTRGESGSSFEVSLADDEAFQVIFSALGSSMTTTTTTTSSGPMDVVIILDNSSSMGRYTNVDTKYTRLEAVTDASNELISKILSNEQNRLAVVTYSTDSTVILPLNHYEQNDKVLTLSAWSKGSADSSGGVRVEDGDGKMTATATILGTQQTAGSTNNGFMRGTNLQSGIDAGMKVLSDVTETAGRTPVVIVMTDGVADTAVVSYWYNTASGTYRQPSDNTLTEGVALSTLLNASYGKSAVEAKYGKDAMVYGVGVDLDENSDAEIVMNPQSAFNSSGNTVARTAYSWFTEWQNATSDVSKTDSYGTSWKFNQLPTTSAVTKTDVVANINYVDTYYDVSSADISDVFEQIYEELSSKAFNPISSTDTVDGATGVKDTPLIYVDYIGKYMEIKDIQAITLFGASYNVIHNADSTYTVTEATGTNPTTNEAWNTAEDIIISVTETDGIQKLEIKIKQEILPIILEQVISKTVGETTTSTITEVIQNPLRVYYTVGLSEDIILENGQVDYTKLSDYKYLDTTNGTATFYSNQFGVVNEAVNNVVTEGDAHVGFRPSAENRYYYHQANHGIFTEITDKSNESKVTIDENELYGIVWDEEKYSLTWMTYNAYLNATDDDIVYTYVTYYRPTESSEDAENVAEEVTYLVYTKWQYLKESVAFYDAAAKKYINDGKVMTASEIAAYKDANATAEIYAVLGVNSLRTSRFHNMIREKVDSEGKVVNPTGTATLSYAPAYTYSTAEDHNGNDVVVWLGNNGKLTVNLDVETGIALTKNVTETFGNPTDTYEIKVTVPQGVTATPVVTYPDGTVINTAETTNNSLVKYENNVLTVKVKAGETVYITGIPGGTECTIDEIINGNYYISEQTATVTVPTKAKVLAGATAFATASVTNAPIKTGNLYITKEITSDHTVPTDILNKSFEITVEASALAGKTFVVKDSATENPYTSVTFGSDGREKFNIKHGQTIEILDLPANVEVTVTETTPATYFTVSYRTRNGSGTEADTDNKVTIPVGANATAVVINTYTPASTTVDLDIVGTKNFDIEGDHDGEEFNFKVQKWNGTAWEDISDKTTSVTYNANGTGTTTFAIENVLEGINYTTVGTWAYQVLEVKGSDTNITYDRTLYTFTVTVTDNNGQLVAKVTDLDNKQISNTTGDDALDYVVTFNNTYHTAPISIDIIKTVVNESGDTIMDSKAGFTFKVEGATEDWEAVEGYEPLYVYSDAAGEARLTRIYTAGDVNRTHRYIITEVGTDGNGWNYSSAKYHATVTVTKNSNDGNLVADMSIEAVAETTIDGEVATVPENDKTTGTVVFRNIYNPEDETVSLDGKVKKQLDGALLSNHTFTFNVYKNGTTEIVSTGTSSADGSVTFDKKLTFDKVGKYEYDIKEVVPKGAILDKTTGKYVLNGVYYDPTVYDLVVEVTLDAAEGKLVATYYYEDATTDYVTFKNEYKTVPTSYTFEGTKVLYGRTLKAGEFEFELYEVKNEVETLVETVKNDKDGNFVFTTLHYNAEGIHNYVIKEKAGTDNIVYDNTTYKVTVTVTDTSGILSAKADTENTKIKFVNNYVEYTLGGVKELSGRSLKAGEFTFELYEDDTKIREATNKADGTFTFPAIIYKETGEHTYTIKETQGSTSGIHYNDTIYEVKVTVTEDTDGKMTASADANNPAIKFTNIYEAAPAKVIFNGTKTFVGNNLTDGKFSFNLYQTDYTFDIANSNAALKKSATNNKNGIYKITEDLASTGTYYFALAENIQTREENIVYDQTQYNYIVTVTDDGSGQLKAVMKEVNTGISSNPVAEITIDNIDFTNAIFDEVTEKTVYLDDDETTNIDGNKVNAGDILTYFITYANYTGEDVVVDIMDTIPENTSYVNDSAFVINPDTVKVSSVTYAGTHVNWILEVPKDGSVQVGFKVKVDETEVIVDNTAVVRDGVNIYTTNEVKNHTVETPAEKNVFLAENTTISIDGEKVYAGDELLYTVSYTNASPNSVNIKITDKIPQHTTYVGGSADNGGVYNEASKELTWEINDVAAWSTVTVSFKVKVDANMKAVTIENKAAVVAGENEYQTNKVTNYTVKDEVKKDVFSSEKPDVSIDGKEVYAGDELVYTISYKNTDTKAADVTITDNIPEATTYVDNSADNGGVYSNGTVTWNINDVPAGETVKVSFKVKVNDVYVKTITNGATVVEGKITYTTNTVKNNKNNDFNVDILIHKNVTSTGDIQHTLGGFDFQLKNVTDPENIGVPEKATSDNNGDTKYILTFNGDDNGNVYKYELVEIDQGEKDMTYDTTVHKFEIEIVVDTEGKLVAKIKQNGATVSTAEVYFNNTYSGKTTVPDEPTDPGKTVVVPNTGDTTNTVLYADLMVLSAAALLVILFAKKRKKDSDKEA